ncbi:uncharacterized protein TA11930 [Theileria annulata]|uniref:Uncharacterized protein n=1 Tax=Theileria annulata TaxID=5874 RepID=Q4UDR5_THEAN|nr:uncharacterized protein TA11930 [Theileria annulata]CAI74774.1 hypothetical protein TA11930 [Theileria annulata]|eukprot:XP_952506.1 hypothetical protein TA11930 [Theileria annulata]
MSKISLLHINGNPSYTSTMCWSLFILNKYIDKWFYLSFKITKASLSLFIYIISNTILNPYCHANTINFLNLKQFIFLIYIFTINYSLNSYYLKYNIENN